MTTRFVGDTFLFENKNHRHDKNIHINTLANETIEFISEVQMRELKLGENWKFIIVSNELHIQSKDEAGIFQTRLKLGD